MDASSGRVLLGTTSDDRRIAAVADATRDRIVAIDLQSGNTLFSAAMSGGPTALAATRDRVYVALRDANAIAEVTTSSSGVTIQQRIDVPAEPTALAIA